jgi:hypothetical protein
MPRPKSELTSSQKCVGAKLTQWQYEEWKRLGASKWLKQMLTESRKNLNEIRKTSQGN